MANIIVIPARMGSKRLRDKPMIPIHGKPMVVHVAEKALQSKRADQVIVATDSKKIANAIWDCDICGDRKGIVCKNKIDVKMTCSGCKSGTDRIASLATTIMKPDDIVVNVQGDLPFVDPRMPDQLFDYMLENEDVEMATVAHRRKMPEDIGKYKDPNSVKVVRNNLGQALYFSRDSIPHNAEEIGYFHHHIGMYAYRAGILKAILAMEQSDLEKAECLEQLRPLGMGIQIQVLETEYEVGMEINTPQDWKQVRAKSDWWHTGEAN